MTRYLKLEDAPELVVQRPKCGICDVWVDYDEGLTCPVCGTRWISHQDGATGTLYEDWSGESLDGPTIAAGEAWEIAQSRVREERRKFLASVGIVNPAWL